MDTLYRIYRRPVVVQWAVQYFPEMGIQGVEIHPDRTGLLVVNVSGEEISFSLNPGDWIIQEYTGEIHACRVHTFHIMYEPTGWSKYRRKGYTHIGKQAESCYDIEILEKVFHVHRGDWVLFDTKYPFIIREQLFDDYYDVLGVYNG